MKAGRPKKTLNEAKKKLPVDWFNQILNEYSEGASDVNIKAMFVVWLGKFSNDLWDRWMEDEDEFSETIKNGKILSESWWTKTGRKNLSTKDFSYTGWYMNMKNRFGWSDKIQQETKTESKLNISVAKGLDELLND
jgi:hypothetical protein